MPQLDSYKRIIYMNNSPLYAQLCQLNIKQFKIIYGIIVHCRAHDKHFFSTQNFFNMWCELNEYCHELDESFPDMHHDHNLIKDFCQQHPYYFIDILPLNLVSKLFAEHCDTNPDVLTKLVKILLNHDSRQAHRYIVGVSNLEHTADELVQELEEHIKYNSSY